MATRTPDPEDDAWSRDVEWSFAADDRAAHGRASVRGPLPSDRFRGSAGAQRAGAVERALARALEAYWANGSLPPSALLRDGLLLLEAGHPLPDAERSLLARTALALGRGRMTALRHLQDPERAAALVHEALLTGTLSDADLGRLLREDPNASDWAPHLLQELRAALASPVPGVARRARRLIDVVQTEPGTGATTVDTRVPATPFRRPWARALAALLMVAALAVLWVRVFGGPGFGDVVLIPEGRYEIVGESGVARSETLGPTLIDRTEVTNRAYRTCYAEGACPWPTERGSATRDPYFLDPLYANHPVVYLPWDSARQFCAWRGMRLPAASEWQVAAAYAPETERTWRYPWGNTYDNAYVIGPAGHADTAEVGSRSPSGDSPLGVADMAGNVAEWTATFSLIDSDAALVKGGSYRDRPDAFRATSFRVVKLTDSTPEIGFRCAADAP